MYFINSIKVFHLKRKIKNNYLNFKINGLLSFESKPHSKDIYFNIEIQL